MGILFGPGSLFESLSNPSKWWDHFKNGTVNDVNLQIANQNLQYQKDRNAIEDARYEDETSYNRAFAENERAYNRAFAENERAYNRAFAEEQRDYNRALQQQIFEREDTAIERQAQSLSKLGINPLSQSMNGLGAGQAVSSTMPSSSSSASSSIPSASSRGGQALYNDFIMQDAGNMSSILSLLNSIENINTNGIQRDLLLEQKDFQRLQNEAQAIENNYLAEKRASEIADLKSSTKSKEGNEKRSEEKHPYEVEDIKATAERNERENKFQKDWNLTDNTNSKARTGADIAQLFSTTTEKQKNMIKNSPLNIIADNLTNSAKIVANSLAETFNASKEAFKKFRKKSRKWIYSPSEFEKAYHK